MTDFFEEIEENLRSDRYRQMLQRAWPWVAGVAAAALLAALAWWGVQTWRERDMAKASQTYAAALDSLQKGDATKAFNDFGDVTKTSSNGYKSLAFMGQAGIRMAQGKTEEAVQLFDKAATAAPNPIVGDLARLKSALALMDTAPYAAMEERLKPLTDAKRPYHAAAREALAMAKLKAGRLAEARSDMQVLQLMSDATESSRQRAQVAIQAIDSGAAANLTAIVKAAQALPPAPPTPLTPNGAPPQDAPAGAGDSQ